MSQWWGFKGQMTQVILNAMAASLQVKFQIDMKLAPFFIAILLQETRDFNKTSSLGIQYQP